MKRLVCLLLVLLLLPCIAAGDVQTEEKARKVAYLTFDDGPKKDTPELLALLDELDVPATFFLMGASVEAFPEYAKMIVDAGYPVGCHTMTHSYKRLKESNDYVARDFERFIEIMRTHTDPQFTTDLYRFPGGSSSYSKRTKEFVRDMGLAWFDWNAMNGDAHYTFTSDEEMIRYTRSTIGSEEDVLIILMHEGKIRTRRTLTDLVAYLREEGYEMRALSTSEEERAILQNCPAHMMLPETAVQAEGEM
ncbi:MAG: polysaccharide deacetylase family protein [Clostridia bacterium]|nr:polysaccharide deacetylase family protein [Clostridia bacterium]